MILFNNRYISSHRIVFLLVDTFLLLGSAAVGYYFRFGWKGYAPLLDHLLYRGLFFAFVFQISLYYFELYEFKVIRDSSKFVPRFIKAVVVSLAVLMIAYYIVPNLYLGRGVLLSAVPCAIGAVFLWRIIYRPIVKGKHMKERVIILGTGEFAREITREIRNNGDSGFEVIGHIIDAKAMEDKA